MFSDAEYRSMTDDEWTMLRRLHNHFHNNYAYIQTEDEMWYLARHLR